jgi:hypothetical protein
MVGRISTGAGSFPPPASNFTLQPVGAGERVHRDLADALGVLVLGARRAHLAALDVAPAEGRLGALALPRADLAEDQLFPFEIGVIALGHPAQAIHRVLPVVLDGDPDLHRLAGRDLVVVAVGLDLDLQVLPDADRRRVRRRLRPVHAQLGELGRDLDHLVLAGLLDEVVRGAQLLLALLGARHAQREIAREADGEVHLELVVDVAPALAHRLALGAGELVAHHLARLARGRGARVREVGREIALAQPVLLHGEIHLQIVGRHRARARCPA